MPAKRNALVAPKTGQKMNLIPGFLETELIIEDFIFIEIAFYKYSYLIFHHQSFS